MTAAQLGRRIGVSRETIKTLERSEARGTVTLESLDRLAKGLGCRVVYAIVPEEGRSVEALRRARALELAREQFARVSHSMKLEAQTLDARKARQHIERIADEILLDSPRKLWQ
jgi:predicted DNA-binding mobile mystery protein A